MRDEGSHRHATGDRGLDEVLGSREVEGGWPYRQGPGLVTAGWRWNLPATTTQCWKRRRHWPDVADWDSGKFLARLHFCMVAPNAANANASPALTGPSARSVGKETGAAQPGLAWRDASSSFRAKEAARP